MADTGAKAPTAAESVAESPWSTSNCGWVNPTYIYGAGEAAITHPAFDTDTYSYVLKAYTFDFSAIPDTATITGVSVTVNARYANGACGIALMQLLNTSRAKVGTNLASTPTALTTSAADYNFPSGGAPTLWGNALTPAWVKDADFGVAIGVRPTALNADVYVDSVVMTVYYQPQIVFTCTDTLALAEQAPTVTITTEGPATFSVSTGLSVAEQPPTVQVGTVIDTPSATALSIADSIGELRIGQVGLSLAEALMLSEELNRVVPVVVPVFDSLSLADALSDVSVGTTLLELADTLDAADVLSDVDVVSMELTEVIRYVDPNSAGGDGTTDELSGANAAYASLSAWNTAEAKDLVSANEYHRVICSSDGASHLEDTTLCIVDGWGTDATHYVSIEASSTNRAGTSWSTTKYRMRVGSGVTAKTPLQVKIKHCRVTGIQLDLDLQGMDPTTWGLYPLFVYPQTGGSDGAVYYVRYCYARYRGAPNTQQELFWKNGIWVDCPTVSPSVTPLVYVYNNIISNECTGTYSSLGTGLNCNDREMNAYIYNNTIVGPWVQGIAGDDTSNVVSHYLKNNLISGATTATVGDHTNTRCDYNATDLSGLGYTAGSNDHVSHTFSFASATNFALTSSDTGAKDLGVSDPGSGLFSDDINGTTRSGTWDIGAHEYVASGIEITGLTDNLALTDSLSDPKVGTPLLSLADAVTSTDALSDVALGGVLVEPQADTFEIADSTMLALGGVGGSVEESVALVDAAALQLGEALLSASDSADFSDAPPDVAVGEAILELADALDASEDLTVTATGGGATKFDDIRGDIILGLNSAQSELTGWNAEVRDKLDVSAVVRTDDYTVTITLPPMAGYDITAPETITVTIPAVATDAGIEIVGEPTFDIGLSTLVTLSVQDTLSSEETMTSQVSDVTLTLADAIALAESLSNVKPGDLIVALADNFSVDDALSGLTLGALLVSLAEAAALSDSVDPRLGTLLLELAEAVAAADDATLLHGPVGLTLADDVALTEEQAAKISDLLASVVESLDAAEYLTAQVGDASIIYFNVYDILDIVESLTSPKIGNLLVSLTDSLTAAEEAAPQVGSLAILGADTVDASDSLTAPVIGGLLVNFAESVSLADVLPLLSVGQVRIDGAENLSLAEQVEARIGNLKIAADDALSIADVLTTQISGVLVTVNDSLAATTELTVWLSGASIIYFNVSDSLTLAETLAVLPSGLRVAIEDALAAGDAVALRSDIHLTLADALAIAEELNAPKISGLLVAMAETLTAAEIVTEALGQTTFTLADSLSATDVLSKTLSDLRLSLSDDVIVSEEAAAALTGLKVAVDETLALIEQFSTFGLDVGLQHADAVALIESLVVQVNLLASQVFEAEARLRAYQATPRARAFQARKRGRAHQATPRETEYVAPTRKRNYTGEVH